MPGGGQEYSSSVKRAGTMQMHQNLSLSLPLLSLGSLAFSVSMVMDTLDLKTSCIAPPGLSTGCPVKSPRPLPFSVVFSLRGKVHYLHASLHRATHLLLLVAGARPADHAPQKLHQPIVVLNPVDHLHHLDSYGRHLNANKNTNMCPRSAQQSPCSGTSTRMLQGRGSPISPKKICADYVV